MNMLALDIGGTKIAFAEIERSGKICGSVKIVPTPKNADEIADLVQKVTSSQPFAGLAIATAGVVFKNKVQGKPTNLPSGYEDIDFAKISGLKTTVVNDANAAAWAEYQGGALKGYGNAAMLTLGTGVGCGLILNDLLYEGKSGAAGEVLFPIAGGDLAELAKENGLPTVDCFEIKRLSESDNKWAKKAFGDWQSRLVDSLILLNQILDLGAIALSGSLAEIVDYEKVTNAVNKAAWHNPPRILPAAMQNNAGLVGAALWWRKCNG